MSRAWRHLLSTPCSLIGICLSLDTSGVSFLIDCVGMQPGRGSILEDRAGTIPRFTFPTGFAAPTDPAILIQGCCQLREDSCWVFNLAPCLADSTVIGTCIDHATCLTVEAIRTRLRESVTFRLRLLCCGPGVSTYISLLRLDHGLRSRIRLILWKHDSHQQPGATKSHQK